MLKFLEIDSTFSVVALAFGAKESATINNVFTIVNVSVVLYVIVCGSINADPSNWSLPPEDIPEGSGKGGFFPFGIAGVIKGAAICFYGFIGKFEHGFNHPQGLTSLEFQVLT